MAGRVTISGNIDISQILSSIEQIKAAFNQIDPSSTLQSKLNRVFFNAQKEASNLSSKVTAGFTAKTDVDKSLRSIQKINSLMQEAQRLGAQVKFGDVIQTQAVADSITDINNQIKTLREQMKNVRQSAFNQVLNIDDFKNSVKDVGIDYDKLLNPERAERALNKVSTSIETEIQKITTQLTQLDNVKTTLAASAADPVKSIEQMLNEASNTKGTGFKPGGFQQLQEELKKIYNIDVDKGTFAQVKTSLLEMFGTLTPSVDDVNNKIIVLNQTLSDLGVKSGEVATAQGIMQAVMSGANVDDIKTKIQALIDTMTQMKTQVVSAAVPYDKLAEAVQTAGQKSAEANEELQLTQKQLNMQSSQDAAIGRMDSYIKRWISLGMVLRQVRTLVSNMATQIKDLDKSMTGIAVVTDMDLSDLWGQIDTYMSVAKQFGVTTKGVYEVSQLYYQMGLKQSEVTQLTAETLKLSKISNLDYAASTDLMTVALRGFNIEVVDASRITNVYSRLAAITASDVSELATAMSKTASGAASVGATFENTSAFLARMIEATR